MICVSINGENVVYDGIITLKSLIEMEGYFEGRIAIEKNGSIVPKARYENELVSDGDRLEIVTLVGGG